MQSTSPTSTPPPQAFPAPATPPPKPNRELFHKRLPSAIKVTDVEQAKQLLQQKINEGFRWVTSGFIDDDRHCGYRVTVAPVKPTADNGDFLGPFPSKFLDVIIFDNTMYYEDARTGTVKNYSFTSNINQIHVKRHLESYIDAELTARVRCLYPTPVMKAKQMPDIAVDDWVVLEGKVMRLVKADDSQCQSLEAGFFNAQLDGINVQYAGNPDIQLQAVHLSGNFFPDSYARVAGAYIRRLERFQHLEPVFYRFFDVSEFDSSDPIKKHPKINSLSISLYEDGKKDGKLYTKFQRATLKLDPLTVDDLKSIKKCLGITIDLAVLDASPPKTIADVVPFKKVLEILTYYNPERGIPMAVVFKVGSGSAQFILSPDDKQSSQLIVSVHSSNQNGDAKYMGNAYPWWMNNFRQSGPPVSAEEANLVLNRPLSATTSITPKMIEFLACTHIAESHFTPGKLNSSRVPGSGKLARAIVRRHTTPLVTDMSTSFDAKVKTPYPMAAKWGTDNTRRAVNSLRRDGGTRAENTHAYDMSDDSDVGL